MDMRAVYRAVVENDAMRSVRVTKQQAENHCKASEPADNSQ